MTEEQEKRIKAIEDVVGSLIDKVESLTNEVVTLKKTAVKKSTGLFGGKREKTAIKDTKTGKVYPSKASVGKNLAKEFNLDPLDSFVWYKIITQAPDRFIEASPEEAKKAWDEQAAETQRYVDEQNRKLQAEAKAKAEKK